MTASAPATPHRTGWLTVLLIAQMALALVAMTITLPSMQEWPAIFGASQSAVQLTFSGYIAANGIAQLLYGALSDRHGRRPLLLFGLGLAAAASLLGALASSLALLTLARILQGAGFAAAMVIGRALVQDLYTGSERTRVLALVGMTMGVCPPLATLLGGQLHVRLGWPSTFVLMAIAATASLAWAWRSLPRTAPPVAPARAGGWLALAAGYGQLVRSPAFVLYVLILASTAASFYSFLGAAPIVLASYGVTPERIGWYIMYAPLSYIVGNVLTTRLVRRMGEPTLMTLGHASTMAGLLVILGLALAGVNTPLALAVPMLLFGIGHGLIVPPVLAGTVGLVPALAGSAAAVAGLMQQVVGATGGYLVGFVPHENALNLAWMMIAWTAFGIACQFLLLRVVLPRGRVA